MANAWDNSSKRTHLHTAGWMILPVQPVGAIKHLSISAVEAQHHASYFYKLPFGTVALWQSSRFALAGEILRTRVSPRSGFQLLYRSLGERCGKEFQFPQVDKQLEERCRCGAKLLVGKRFCSSSFFFALPFTQPSTET